MIMRRSQFNICERNKCVGCGSCMQSCPVYAISMEFDHEGFIYPIISEKCTQCGKCKTVCPRSVDTTESGNVGNAYAIQLQDGRLLKQSTSGGVFILLAEYVLERRGVVIGASFDSNMVVRHTVAQKIEDVYPMQGSKYVQSELGHIYTYVKKYLNEDRYVLFSGTPCQTEGLLDFLRDRSEKLILMDIICGGVPSPLLFQKHLENIEKKHHSKIVDYKFRDKFDYGCSHTTIIYEKKGESVKRTVIQNRDDNSYFVAFGKQSFSRPSCYDCEYNRLSRRSDFTCGGYFGNNTQIKSMGEAEGISSLIVHAEKGMCIFEEIKFKANQMPISIEDVKEGNRMLYESVSSEKRCPEMFDYLNERGYKKTANKYFPARKFTRIKKLLPTSVKNQITELLIKQ